MLSLSSYIQVIQLYEHPVISFITQILKQVYQMQCDSISSFFQKNFGNNKMAESTYILYVYTIGSDMTFQNYNKFIAIKKI